MNHIINNLPKLSKEQENKKEKFKNVKRDNFTVKKCQLSENFASMDSDMFSKFLLGAKVENKTDAKDTKETFIQIKSGFSGVTKTEEPPVTIKNLPLIQGITKDEDNDVKEEDDTNIFTPDTVTKVYVGSLSVIGLFILYRVIKKSM